MIGTSPLMTLIALITLVRMVRGNTDVLVPDIGAGLNEWTDLGLFDTDILSAKAQEAGFTLACCRDLFIHHFGTRTFAHGAPQTADAGARAVV